MVDRRLQRPLVEADLRVREVVVVQENQVGAGQADELGNIGEVSVDIQLREVGADEFTVLQVVEADAEAVGPDRRVVRRGRLLTNDGCLL